MTNDNKWIHIHDIKKYREHQDCRAALNHYREQYERLTSIVQGWADFGEYWRKKYLIVCKENNALRRKVSK